MAPALNICHDMVFSAGLVAQEELNAGHVWVLTPQQAGVRSLLEYCPGRSWHQGAQMKTPV